MSFHFLPFFAYTLCIWRDHFFSFGKIGEVYIYIYIYNHRYQAGRVSTLPTRLRIGGSAAGSESGIKQSITAVGTLFKYSPRGAHEIPALKLNAKRPIKAYNDWYEHGNANVLSFSGGDVLFGGQRMMDRWKKWPMWAGFGVSCDTHVTGLCFSFTFDRVLPAPLSARFSNPSRFFCYFFFSSSFLFSFFLSPASLVRTRIFFGTTRGNWTRQPGESERTSSAAIIGTYVPTAGQFRILAHAEPRDAGIYQFQYFLLFLVILLVHQVGN